MKRIFFGICALILFLGLLCAEGTLVLAGLRIVPDPTLSDMVRGEEIQASLASSLIDRHVRNQLGHELGQVNDLVFQKDGRIAYVLLSQSEGRELIPIPFRSIRFDQHENGFIMTSEDKTRLEGAPAIGKDQWNRLEDPIFEKEVFNYYGEGQIQKEKKLK
ncbi:MAG: PRC-barrel domain-containing protein [Desulfobacterales bacterium]|nr:PRC-barrel domain-containing protein [Desulfobacterales bacterium]